MDSMKLNWKQKKVMYFWKGGRVQTKKIHHPSGGGGGGYFLEPHNQDHRENSG